MKSILERVPLVLLLALPFTATAPEFDLFAPAASEAIGRLEQLGAGEEV